MSEVPVHDPSATTPRAIHARDWRWLTNEADAWMRDGLIDADLRARIVARYHVDRAATERRGLMVLTALACVAGAIAVLLLIGYNWDAIPRAVKVALIVGTVAATFAGSAAAYARGRTGSGELLAFLGTLFYGNAIWLLAQVFHIQGRYPDGALWWAIGALVAAHVLSSWLIAVQAAVLVIVWLLMDTTFMFQPSYQYLALGAAAVWLAYRVRSAWVLALSIGSIPLWIAASSLAVRFDAVTIGLVLLTGCGFQAAAKLHPPHSRFGALWEALGLSLIGACLIPLMIHELHDEPAVTLAMREPLLMVVPVALGLIAWVAVQRGQAVGNTIGGLAILTTGWIVWRFTSTSPGPAALTWIFVLAFSAATLLIGITMMRAAMQQDRAGLFAGGVGFVLLFLLVRWIDLLGSSMIWSAVFLFAVAGLLLWMARVWKTRRAS